MALVHYANEVVGIDSYALHARSANPYAGPSKFYFILDEMVSRLGYGLENQTYVTPRPEISEILNEKQGYYATVLRFGIEELAENCPVPANFSNWF
jgi:hypothetical protein